MGHKHAYGVVIDAGSSGSRAYVYEYEKASYIHDEADPAALTKLPVVKTKKKWRHKVHTGISTFGEKPERVGADHLDELVEFAKKKVPRKEWEDTPIFLLATAGMRLLPDYQQVQLLDTVCAHFRKTTPFQLPDCDAHVQIIPGETEGLYGWIAANYLLGGFDEPVKNDHGKGHHTYGFLDMGGASAQIAFAPNKTEAARHADDLKLLRLRKANGESLEFGVFVTTWLGFGANEARKEYVDHLLKACPGEQEIPDPCLPNGLLAKLDGEEIEPGSGGAAAYQTHLLGTGKFDECLHSVYPLLGKDKKCNDPPCLLNGVHTPAIDFDVNHFVGVSNFWHITHEVFAMAHEDKAYDFETYQNQVLDFCSRDWKDMASDAHDHKWGKKVDEKTVEEVCFKASWLINVLHDGIGVPRVGVEHPGGNISDSKNKTDAIVDKAKDRGFLDPFQAVDEIEDTEVSWTLGKMVLYASSQMPAANDKVQAVGFGQNVPGSTALPADWQHPGGQYDPLPGVDGKVSEDDADWHDRIFNSSYSRRIPGIVIFLLILALAAYLLCGRERRLSLWHRTLALFGRGPGSPRGRRPKKGGGLGSKLFGSGTEPSYERVLEDADPDDHFELGALSSADLERRSDSSADANPPRTGRTSGWATPSIRGLSPDMSRASPKRGGYFDASSSAGASLPAGGANGLGITPFDRSGLLSRAESKERLAPKPTVMGSRTGSPKRSPLLTPFKESVD